MVQRALTFCFLSLPVLPYCNKKLGPTEREMNSHLFISLQYCHTAFSRGHAVIMFAWLIISEKAK